MVNTGPGLEVAVGPVLAWPVTRGGRDRVVLFGGAGAGGGEGGSDGELGGRAELLWRATFPGAGARGTVAPYATAGVAIAFQSEMRGLVVVGAGIEIEPAARSSWVVEAGVGGGLRLLVGMRWQLGPLP